MHASPDCAMPRAHVGEVTAALIHAVYHDTFINNDDLTEATVQYGGELVEYKVYMPQTFRQIRTMHGIRKDDFCEEWSLEDNQEMSKGAGRSGSLFLRSRNSQYILKSLLKPEVWMADALCSSTGCALFLEIAALSASLTNSSSLIHLDTLH